VDYDHKILPGGISGRQLFEELGDIFQKIASNAEKLPCGASDRAAVTTTTTGIPSHTT
jgi:hypothetical protein